jgi:hypothetical protein
VRTIVCIVACVGKKLQLLGSERPDHLLKQQVDCKTNARKRSLQLMAHRCNEVRFHLVEQPKTCHVLKHHGDSSGDSLGITNGQDARQVVTIPFAHRQFDGLLETRWDVGLLALDRFRDGAAQPPRRSRDRNFA